MKKDFDTWNRIKKETHESGVGKFYNTRDIWWCRLGVNIGYEQDGDEETFERPVVVMRGLGKDICVVVPLTTSKSSHKYRISVGVVEDKEARALVSQVRVVDTKRFVNKIARLDKEAFSSIQKAVKDFF